MGPESGRDRSAGRPSGVDGVTPGRLERWLVRLSGAVAERTTQERTCRPQVRHLGIEGVLALEVKQRLRIGNFPSKRVLAAPWASRCPHSLGVQRDDRQAPFKQCPGDLTEAFTGALRTDQRSGIAKARTPAGAQGADTVTPHWPSSGLQRRRTVRSSGVGARYHPRPGGKFQITASSIARPVPRETRLRRQSLSP